MINTIRRHGRAPWSSPVPVSAAVSAADFVFTSACSAVNEAGKLDSTDGEAQLDNALARLERTLSEAGSSLDAIVKLGLFYANDPGLDELRLLRRVRQRFAADLAPALTAIPLHCLPYPGMKVQIDAVAVRKEIPRLSAGAVKPWAWPQGAAFSHAVRAGNVVFVGGQMSVNERGETQHVGRMADQAQLTIDNMRSALGGVGADLPAVVKLNTFYVGHGTQEDWEKAARVRSAAFTKPGPGATGVPVPGPYPNGLLVRQDSVAIVEDDGSPAPRETSWPKGHWDWPIKVSFEQGLKLGPIIIPGGQVALDAAGAVMHPGDLPAQAADCMDMIQRIFAGFGASTKDLAKVTFLYATEGDPQDAHVVLDVLRRYFADSLPAVTAVPLAKLGFPDLRIEIEGIGIVAK
jgi:enamine deaminase RidA (YjgF/YER057c/UK114 family)